jgi:hypothetical protein
MKPVYLLLSFLLVRLLWRARATPLRLLRHGLLWFFVGETLCAVNFYLHRPGLLFPIELLHGLGMVAMSALVPWGLWRLLDDRVLRYDDPEAGCAVQRLCGRCWKREPVRCGLHDLMYPLVVALAVVALMPLTAPLRPTMFTTEILVFYAALGFTLYPLLRHLLANAYRDALYWSDFWEEATELVTIASLAALLVLFRRPLGLARDGEAADAAAPASAR